MVGSIDTLLSLISKVTHKQGKIENLEDTEISGILNPLCRALTVRGDYTVFIAMIISILYSIAFLCTILMSKVDILIAVRGGESVSILSTIWATQLLANNNFNSQLNDWQILDQVRVVCALLGWAGSCYLSYKSVTAVDSKNTEIYRYGNINIYRQFYVLHCVVLCSITLYSVAVLYYSIPLSLISFPPLITSSPSYNLFLSHSLFFPHTHTLSHTLSPTQSHPHSLTPTHSLSLTPTDYVKHYSSGKDVWVN